MGTLSVEDKGRLVPIPLVVIGGYLGSGKTSLINHLLRNAAGRRIAVLVNDFGEVSIDAELIEGASGNVIALAGGCVCCSFGEDLVGGLRQIVQRSPAPDVIVLECSGVGLPAAVASSAALVREVQVEGIVVLVDSAEVRQQSQNRYVGETVQSQLMQADLLVLNHQDRCAPGQSTACAAWLAGAAPGVPQICSSQGLVEPSLILGLKPSGVSEPRAQEALSRWSGGTQDVRSGATKSRHPMRYGTRLVSEAIDPETLARELISQAQGRLLRAKGVVPGLDGRWWQLQIMGRRIDVRPLSEASTAHGGKLVFIEVMTGD